MKDGTIHMGAEDGLTWLGTHQTIKFTLFIKLEKNLPYNHVK